MAGSAQAVSFSVGVTSGYGDKAVTTWANCTMWGDRAEKVMPYLTKGKKVGIVGEVTLTEYTSKSGEKGKSLEVRVNDLTLLGEKAKPSAGESAAKAQRAPDNLGDIDSDLPF